MFTCNICEKCFNTNYNLKRHTLQVHEKKNAHSCTDCSKKFARKSDLLRHRDSVHSTEKISCKMCATEFSRKDNLDHHLKNGNCRRKLEKQNKKRKRDDDNEPNKKMVILNNQQGGAVPSFTEPSTSGFPILAEPSTSAGLPTFAGPSTSTIAPTSAENLDRTKLSRTKETKSAFKKAYREFTLKNYDREIGIPEFLRSKKDETTEIFLSELQKHESLKVRLLIFCIYQKVSDDFVKQIKNVEFKTANKPVFASTNKSELYEELTNKLILESEDFQEKDSGWTLGEIIELEIHTNKFTPLRGSTFVELPEKIRMTNAVINVKNSDTCCFKWSILAAVFPADRNPNRVSNYEDLEKNLNFEGINFPTPLSDVKKFSKNNNISINVYSFDKELNIFPLLVSEVSETVHIDLLLVPTKHEFGHYCLIKNLSRLVSKQYSNHGHKVFICKRCLVFFNSEDSLIKHKELCDKNCPARVVMPSEESKYIKFKNFQHVLKVPFTVYADFECLTLKTDSCSRNPNLSSSTIYQKHAPFSFCYYICYDGGFYKPPVIYRGEDASKVFVESIKNEALEIEKIYRNPKPLKPLNEIEQKLFDDAKNCYACSEPFSFENKKVRDHNHVTQNFNGACCNRCNLLMRVPNFLPVFFHNLAGYDAHIFVKELGYDNFPIFLIPNNEERYISFSKTISKNFHIRFIDTLKFMPASLDSLISTLSKNEFKHMNINFPSNKIDLLLRKGIFPYDYFDDFKKCNETSLPSRDNFYNKLNEEEINEDDYRHALNVFQTFNLITLGDYCDLYVKTDVLLLADLFENFRNICLKTYNLDPCWYYTAPALSWDAMLFHSKITLELITDYDMILFIEKGIRGGISQCCNRYSKANNKYMDTFNPNEQSKFLIYLDANNLYGFAMSQSLPLNKFSWCSTDIDVEKIPDDSKIGYILEVDLNYPDELHDHHSDFPVAPENKPPPNCRLPRLLTTLEPKLKYVIYYKNLKLYLKLGLKLTKIHRVLQFNQSPWLQSYIDFNTKLRTNSKTDFHKDFYKLMNNSIFGKTMENIRRRVNIRLCTSSKQVSKLIAKPNFEHRTIFSENLMAVHMKKTKIHFSKPIQIGMVILEASKILMYSFHYETMKETYGSNIRLMYTDTDSFIYEVQTSDMYADIKNNINLYDTSDYDINNIYNIPLINKKVLGKMKDENKGRIMSEFIGLKSKMYAYKTEEKTEKRLKGIKKQTLKNKITFHDYFDCLFSKKNLYAEMNFIRSKHHNIHSVHQNKLALSFNDEKRHILEDGITTLAHGHYKLRNEEITDE
ncbi:uncharacterized protein [Parasteatoda tepidariorum]|nr:uncharacterized protein LOC110282522 [Parasteatoda tepidariorum]